MSPINVNLFNYYKPDNSLSADISTLEGAGHKIGRKFVVKSRKTGNEIEFHFDHAIYDNSHEDIMGWEFKSVNPKAPVRKVTIWNE